MGIVAHFITMKFLLSFKRRLQASSVLSNSLLLLACLLASGGLSMLMGQDASIDLLNYHLYNPFSLLNGRWGTDLIPAGMHSFFNPILDVPYYVLLHGLNDFPRLTAFIQGWGYGLFLFFAWKICALLWPGFSSAQEKLIRLSAFILSVTGTAALSQVGLSSNETPLAAGAACVLWLLLKQYMSAGSSMGWLCASFLTGALFGLKYTFGPTAVGLGAVGLYIWFRTGRKAKLFWGALAGGIAGFMLSNGWFFFRAWHETGNPLFPYFNAIFGSALFDSINLANGIGTPENWKEWLFLPFMRLDWGVIELQTDWRLALGLAACVVWLCWALFTRQKTGLSIPNGFKPVLIFFPIAYILWLAFFSVMRYEIMLDFAGALLLAAALQHFLGKTTGSAVCAITVLALLATPPVDWGRTAYQPKALMPSVPPLQENSLVLLAGHVSFLALSNPQATYIGGIWFRPSDYENEQKYAARQLNILQPNDYRFHFENQIRQKVNSHEGPLYVIGPNSPLTKHPATWERYGLKLVNNGKECTFFTSNIDSFYGGFLLCPAQKRHQN